MTSAALDTSSSTPSSASGRPAGAPWVGKIAIFMSARRRTPPQVRRRRPPPPRRRRTPAPRPVAPDLCTTSRIARPEQPPNGRRSTVGRDGVRRGWPCRNCAGLAGRRADHPPPRRAVNREPFNAHRPGVGWKRDGPAGCSATGRIAAGASAAGRAMKRFENHATYRRRSHTQAISGCSVPLPRR